MAKLKKSIKAIIISLCAVVVIAGSIVGAVFANKDKGKGGDPANPPSQNSPTTPTTPVVPEISFVGSQKELMQTINSSNTKIDTIEKIDSELIESSGFEIDEIKHINQKYFTVKSSTGVDVYLYAKTETEDYEITPLEELLEIEHDYDSFTVIMTSGDYILCGYRYAVDYVTYQKVEVIRIVNGNEAVVVNDFDAEILDSGKYNIDDKYSFFNVQLEDNYYYFLFFKDDSADETIDAFVFEYTNDYVTDADRKEYYNLNEDAYYFADEYYYVSSENGVSYTVLYNGQLYNFDLIQNSDLLYEYKLIDDKLFIEEKKIVEFTTDLTNKSAFDDDSQLYFEYSYKFYDFINDEFSDIKVNDEIVKITYAGKLGDKYICFFEQSATDYLINKIGNFVYYDINSLEPIISYNSIASNDDILYANDTSVLTNSGIYRVKDGIVSNLIYQFDLEENIGYVPSTVNYVSDSFVVYSSSLNNYKVMNMEGEFLFDKTFTSVYEYDDGNYLVRGTDDTAYQLNLNNSSLNKIEDFETSNLNKSLAFAGFGVYFTETTSYTLNDYLGNVLNENVVDFELISISNDTILKLTLEDDSVDYYVKEDIQISSGTTTVYKNDDVELVSTKVDLYADNDAGNSKTYTYNGVTSGTISLTNYSEYTKFEIDTPYGFWHNGGSVNCVGGGGGDAGFTWTFSYSEDVATFYFEGDTRFKDDDSSNGGGSHNDSRGGMSHWVRVQYLSGFSWKNPTGNFDTDGTNSISVSPVTFTVTLDRQGGSDGTGSVSEVYSSSAIAESITKPNARTGYTFEGYYTGTGGSGTQIYNSSGTRVGWTSSTSINDHKTIYAYWRAHTYTVQYEWNGGTKGSYAPTSATYDSTFDVSDPKRVGYTFNGWTVSGMDGCTHNIDGESTTSSSYYLADDFADYNFFGNLTSVDKGTVKLTAEWTANKYTITFDMNNPNSFTDDITSKPSDITATYDLTATVSTVPVKTGYTFTGWYISGMSTNCTHYYGSSNTKNSYISSTKETSYKNLHSGSQTASSYKVTFKALWSVNSYSISYSLGGGKFKNTTDDQPTSWNYDSQFHVTDPVRTGYTFASWTITSASDTGVMGEKVRHYYGASSASTKFEGTSVSSINVEYFKSLRHSGGTVVLTANWTKRTYTVTFDMNNPNSVTTDISSIENKTSKFDEVLTVSEIPTKTGYLFTHWSISGMDVTNTETSETVDHYHHATATTKETMTKVSGVATIGNTTSKKYMNLHSYSGTVTFKANWKPIEYDLSYNENNGDFGSVTNPTHKKYDEELKITSPLRHGYDFTGWKVTSSKGAFSEYTTSNPKAYPNTIIVDFTNVTTADGDTVTFTAQWKPAEYKIYFDYENPTIADETKTGYKYGTEYTIAHPKRMGYIFDYWTISGCSSCDVLDFECKHKHGTTEFIGTSKSDLTDTKFTSLHCVTGSVVTFKANWHAKTYYLINEAAGYGSTLESESVKYDQWFWISAPTSSPLGYHFSGWKVINMNEKDENTNETVQHFYGASTTATTYKTGTTLSTSTEAAKYYFKNLSSNNEASVTIQPIWSPNTYVVTFDMNNPNWFTNDISSQADITATYDTAFSVSYPTKTGYSFTGWSLSVLSDDCTHYYGGSTSAATTAFESNNGKYVMADNPNYYQVTKQPAFKNLRSDRNSGIKAKMMANWKANEYTITYHYLPESFDVTAYAMSELNTKVNIVSQMTVSHTQKVTYDKLFEATNYKRENGEIIFGLPIGLRLITWGMVSGTPAGTTKTAKYNSSNVIETNFTGRDAYGNTISADIYPYEEQIFGVGELETDYTNWIYFTTTQINAGIHLYAAYDLAGINLRYYVPTSASGSNFLQNYVNVENSIFSPSLSHLNTNKKFTEVVTFADDPNIPNYENLVGWMIVQTYDSSGELTKDSLTRYDYQDTTFVAYKGNQANWGFTNVDAYSYEDPTYFLYAVYDEVYSGDFGKLRFTYDSASDSYSVLGTVDTVTSLKIPAYYDNGTTGFKPVTNIQNSAFYGFTSLASIYLPNTITQISSNAFYNCDALTSIDLPDNLKSILSYAFYDCDSLTSLTTPSTLKTIGGYAFYSCGALASVTLNYGLETIGDSYAFYYCPITSITIPSTVTFLGVGTFERTSLTSIAIPKSVQELRGSTFMNCEALKTVTFESVSSVSSIGENAFLGCSKLTSIVLPNSVKSIGGSAFKYCSSMTSITMPDKLTSLGAIAFQGCSKLTSIVMPQGLTAINSYTFQDCAKLASVTLYDGITTIGSYAFDNCASITTLTIPDTVTSIGKAAFRYCAKLATLTIPFVGQTKTSSNNYFGYVFGSDGYATNSSYVPSTLTTLTITNDDAIAACALYGLSKLKNLTISNTVSTIGQDALASVTALVTLSVPFIGYSRTDSTNGYIGYWYDVANTAKVSDYLPYLTTVKITDATAVYNYALYGSSITSVALNEGITLIATSAFGYTNISSITIPSTVTIIGDAAFAYCSNLAYANLSEGLVTIGTAAFDHCIKLTSITIPSTVRTIGQSAFWRCEGLTSAVILDGTTTIGANAFIYCSGLTSVRLPKTITAIPDNMFKECTSLTTIHIQEGVTSIGSYAFQANAITSIKLPSTLTTINGGAFAGCASLASISFPSGLTTISWDAFWGCTSLTKVVIPNSVTTLGSDAFHDCTGLVRAELSTAITTIQANTFTGCTALTTVIFHRGVTSIGDNAFKDCSALTYVYYGGTSTEWNAMTISSTGNSKLTATTNGVSSSNGRVYNFDKMVFTYTGSSYSIGGTPSANGSVSGSLVIPYNYDDGVNGRYVVDEIVNRAYQNHTGLTSVSTSNSITSIGNSAFLGCSAMTSITMSTALTSIGAFAFNSCTQLASITIPSAIKVIERHTFDGCQTLGSITFSSTYTLTTIEEYAFNLCKVLTSIKIPTSVTFIGTYAFSSCYGLDNEVKLPSGLTTLGKGAFYYCTSLDSVKLPDSLKVLDERVFAYCSDLDNVFIPNSIDTISASSAAIAPFYSTNTSLLIFCEDLGKQAGWGPYWNYKDSSTELWTFYDYAAGPSVALTNRTDYAFDQATGKFTSTSSSSSKLEFTAQDFVNLRFEYKTNLKTIRFTLKRKSDSSSTDIYFDNSNVGEEYRPYYILLAPGDVFAVYYASTKIVTINNLRFDAITSASNDYGFAADTSYNVYNSTYHLKSTNYHVPSSESKFTLVANDDVTVDFKYITSTTGVQWDYFQVNKNGSQVLKDGGELSSYKTVSTISLVKGDVLEFKYYKNHEVDGGNDNAIIEDLRIKSKIYFVDDTDVSQTIRATSFDHTYFDISTTDDGWETVYKSITSDKYNSSITFKYRVYQNHNPLSGYLGARIQILNSAPATGVDNISKEVASAVLSTTEGVYVVTINIPNPGTYYLVYNFGHLADYQNVQFDIGCIDWYGFKGYARRHFSYFGSTTDSSTSVQTASAFNSRIYSADEGYLTPSNGRSAHLNNYTMYSFMTEMSRSYVLTAPYSMLLSFQYYYATESDYDYVRFYINDNLIFNKSGNDATWRDYSIYLNKGDVFKITYYHDVSVEDYIDGYYIRNIEMTRTFGFTNTTGSTYVSDNVGVENSEAVMGFNYKSGGTLTFSYTLSSETNNDRIYVYVDGGCVYKSYNVTAATFSRSISAGSQVVIVYKKDGTIDSNNDTCTLTFTSKPY